MIFHGQNKSPFLALFFFKSSKKNIYTRQYRVSRYSQCYGRFYGVRKKVSKLGRVRSAEIRLTTGLDPFTPFYGRLYVS